jgi:E1-E2 ATPase
VLYLGLVLCDQYPPPNKGGGDPAAGSGSVVGCSSSSAILAVAFVGALVLHLSVIVATQWSVSVRVRVGYYICSVPTAAASNTESKKCEICTWTHCWVQSVAASTGGGGGGGVTAGIVPVRCDTDVGSAGEVVVVNFQDRVFRLATIQPDVDATLFATATTSTSSSKHNTANEEDNDDAVSPTRAAAAKVAPVPRFRPVRYPTSCPIQFYASWSGHRSIASCTAAEHAYGPNTTALQLPSFVHLVSEQIVAPFFLFQIFCVVLWSLDEYWYYALFTLFALLAFESTLALNRLRSLQRLHDISHKNRHQRIWVQRGSNNTTRGCWMEIFVRELLPGDYVCTTGSLVPVPADILLMHGTAVCDEALLTGESVPQLKQPLDATSLESSILDMQQQHKESILFGGTVLIVGTPPEGGELPVTVHSPPPPGGVIGIVLRTGFETAQGNLLRTMAHASKNNADGVHTIDTFVFILLLICCAVSAAAHVLYEGYNDERRNRFRLFLHVVMIITSVVPPELPMELSLAVTNSVAALMKRCQVYCTEHFRIPWAGEVTVCCK